MDCPHCATPNIDSARFCLHCGLRLSDEDPVFERGRGAIETWEDLGGTPSGRAEPSLGSDSAWQRAGSALAWMPPPRAGVQSPFELYAIAIGEPNQERYLTLFARFDQQGGSSLGWHWPAFFFTFYWLVYRKMWLVALSYLIVPSLAALGLMAAASRFGDGAVGWGFGIYIVLIFLLPPLVADGVYYRSCRRRVDAALRRSNNADDHRASLRRWGGTLPAAVMTLFLLVSPAVICGLAAIMLVAYP